MRLKDDIWKPINPQKHSYYHGPPESRRRWVNLLGVGGGDAIAETIGGNGILERRGGGGRVGLVMNGEEDGSYYGGIQCLCALEKDN